MSDSYFSHIQQYGGGYAIQSNCSEVENLYFDGVIVKDGGLYHFENTTGTGVVIHPVIKPVDESLNVCVESIRPENASSACHRTKTPRQSTLYAKLWRGVF